MAVRLLPLLRGEVVVDQVSLAGLRASVIRAKGGSFDFEDLLGAAGAAAGGPKPAPAGAPAAKVKFDVAGVSLTDAGFVYVDEGTGQRLEVQDLDLKTGRIAEDEGCAAVALHARTAAQLYDGEARWEEIARLKAAVRSISVLGNGDVWEAWDALRMMRATGCDGVVVGRGCLGRPWLFRDLAEAFAGREPAAPQIVEWTCAGAEPSPGQVDIPPITPGR